jgi:alpha-1,6-mannosyltransferase
MRVVDISSFFSDSCGGIKTYYRHKARYLPALGVDCHFIVPGKTTGSEAIGDGTLHRLEGPPLPGNAQYRLFGARREVASLLRRLAPDVVEVGSHYLLPRWVTDAVADLRPSVAVVGFFHSNVPRTLVEPALRWLPSPLRRAALAAAWRFVRRRHELYDATLVASRDLADALSALEIPRVRWVGLGVDVDLFRPAKPPLNADAQPGRVVAYSGRLAGEKGFTTLLRAWSAIHDATGAVLHVAGAGPQQNQLARLAATRPDVVYRGCFQAPSDVAAFLASAALVVTPGARETFSLSTAEALACGTPVVAPDAGGAGELVARSGGGELFQQGDPGALANAVIRVLQAPLPDRLTLGRRGRAHIVSQFAWPTVAERLRCEYERVCDDVPGRRAA